MATTYLIYILPFFFTLFLLFKFYYSTHPTATKNLPPSPPKLPIIGNIHQLGPLLHRSFFSLSQRCGGRHLMLLHLGSVPSLVVSSAAAAHEIMQTHDLIFATRPPIEMHKTLFYDLKEISVAPYGEYWRQAKKLMILNFLSSNKVQTFSRVREDEIANTVGKITKLSESKKAVNLCDLMSEHSNGVSYRSTFGKKYDEETHEKMKKVVIKLLEVFSRFYYADSIPQLGWIDQISGANSKVEEVAKHLDEFMEEAIEERLVSRKTDDHEIGEGAEPFIDALLRIQNEGVDGISFGREHVKALLGDAYIAGAETSSSALQWVMLNLLTHPEALKKVQTEVRTIVNGKQHITDEDLEKMKYLKAVIMETNRLHPPAPIPFPRLATQDVKIMGYDISKGTRVYINIWAIGRDPNVWDRPNEFVPERFSDASLDIDDFRSIPFGGGRRRCPGKTFAMATIVSVLANLLYKFDWELHDKESVNMEETSGIASHPNISFLAFATAVSS